MTKEKKRKKIDFVQILLYIVLSMGALLILIPCLNLVARSFSDPATVDELKGWNIIPKDFSLVNYQIVFSNPVILRSIINSTIITVFGTTFNIIMTTVAAYVLTREGLVGKKIFMYALIVFMILEPGVVQEYLVFQELHLLDTLLLMIIYKGINVYYLIIMMRFMQEIPPAVMEAAQIDGAGHVSLLFKIVLPLQRVPIITIGMFYAVYHWNEFYKTSIFLTSNDNITLQVLLRNFILEGDSTAIMKYSDMASNIDFASVRAATIVVAVVPILIIYPIILKYLTNGVMSGGVKE